MKTLVCFHLFNDYSGSPKVLRMVLANLLDLGYRIDLITSRDGVLDELNSHPNLKRTNYTYKFSENPVMTAFRYVAVQLYTFCLAFRYLFCKNTFYINTLLPLGPAIAGRLMGKRVVYHYHENANVKGVFYIILCWLMQHLASDIICVSTYQRSLLKRKRKVWIIPNALPETLFERLNPDSDKAFERKCILMLGSLKRYKGTHEFISLANSIPQYHFVLVVNDSADNIDKFLQGLRIPSNLRVFPRQKNVYSFYNQASLVLNLTDKSLAIETFGMTVLEAMSVGLPVIVPTVGGVAEMVEDGVNGYKIDVADLNKIAEHIQNILSDKLLYEQLSSNAMVFSRKFSSREMIKNIETMFNC